MKITSILTLLFFLITPTLFAQKALTKSRTSGFYTYIYKLTDNEAFQIASKSSSIINDSFLHTLVDSLKNDPVKDVSTKKPDQNFPVGHYLYVTPVKNKFIYQLLPVNNVNLLFINNQKDFQFIVTDLKGNPIKNAEVLVGRKTASFKGVSNLFEFKSPKKEGVITINYEGAKNFFTYEAEDIDQETSFFRRIFTHKPKYSSYKIPKSQKSAYQGYMVFNKPMYKPRDTVKFKAYLLSSSGKLIQNKQLKVELQKEYEEKSIAMQTLEPYKDGGYESSFVLEDSLNLKLDQNYNLVMKEEKKGKWINVFSGTFRYEDYELAAINFTVRTDKEEVSPGKPISIYLKATDENDFAIPDGRVEINIVDFNPAAFYDQKVFVKDSLWTKNISIDPVGETKFILPDSIFPKADGTFTANFRFLNSNNESKTSSKQLKYKYINQPIQSEFLKDSLQLKYMVKDQSVKKNAVLIVSYQNTKALDSTQIELPAKIKLNYEARSYLIKTEDREEKHIFMSDLKPELELSALHLKDSLHVVIANVHRIPFWYTIFSNNRVMTKGYGYQLDTLIAHSGSRAAQIQLNYFWNGKEEKQEITATYSPELLNIKLFAPDIVYPGQTVNMIVKVTNVENQPVANTDVTAYAFTTKFKNGRDVQLPDFGRQYSARKKTPIFSTENLKTLGQIQLDWNKWGATLRLDTIEYYKFIHPRGMYHLEEDTEENSTLVAPFVSSAGEILPIHIIYIDDIPVYFDQADQLQRYAFKVSPGVHRLTLRTSDYIIAFNYDFLKSRKTIISIDAELNNEKADVKRISSTLDLAESNLLSSYLIKITNNFGDGKAVLSSDQNVMLLNNLSNAYRNSLSNSSRKQDLLIGPVAENYLNFKSGAIDQTFMKEPGYTYTFLPGLLKQKSYLATSAFNSQLSRQSSQENLDYTQFPLFKGEIDSIWNDFLNLRSYTTSLFNNSHENGKNYGRLQMILDTNISKVMPFVKNILIYKYDELDFLKVYPGSVDYFNPLEAGKYRIVYLFRDNRYLKAEAVEIKGGGLNYFEWKGLKILPADKFSIQIDQQIKSVGQGNAMKDFTSVKEEISEGINESSMVSKFTHVMNGTITDSKDNSPLPGVFIKIKGIKYGVMTNANGFFEIKVPNKGKVVISYIGYLGKELNVKNGDAGFISLDEQTDALQEVVVVGYGSKSKQSLTGAVSQVLVGKMAGVSVGNSAQIKIRGINTSPMGQRPLIIVDGVPFTGAMDKLDPNLILSLDLLKSADAVALYGSTAANGVIIIKTKTGNLQQNANNELVPQQQTMRTKFSDYAIWQPKLFTDENGSVSFTVKFPDDITSWTSRLIAMNGRKQAGSSQTIIKSFKNLSANFVSPTFAIEGDTLLVMGKLLNYSNTEETLNRQFKYNGALLLDSKLSIKNSKIDTVSIVANTFHRQSTFLADSLNFEYTLKQDNGYFDGEIRKIPLLQKGVIETKGYFNALLSDTSFTQNFSPDYGKVTLHAESSVFPVLLDEIEKISEYKYFCNEQLASKLKALLLEKSVRKYLGETFKGEKRIKELIKILNNNKLNEGTWAWWPKGREELWISLHIVEALLQAQKQGYAVEVNKAGLAAYLRSQLAYKTFQDQIFTLEILHLLDEKLYLNDLIAEIEKNLIKIEKVPSSKRSVYETLSILRLKQKAGVAINVKNLLSLKKETMFGNSYWGEDNNEFWNNSIQNTILAYQILRANGNYKAELNRIRLYFFEQKMNGQWRNTYESSLILETILPDLLADGKKAQPAAVTLNKGETITKFPFTNVVNPGKLTISKTGDAAVYFTAFQQFTNPAPQKVDKDFKVKTWFDQKGSTVTTLKAGTLTTLTVEVVVRADADYVMIEVPIPAGCSYENKNQSYSGLETYREYAKDKTSMFCTKLKQGKYLFTIDLMPRYGGKYTLNPAKAEMMYFPVFYGREGMKKVAIN
jgi:TonB-dependent SusC/RagA subfamily outer membrane receptor